jgi:hypothetical protein
VGRWRILGIALTAAAALAAPAQAAAPNYILVSGPGLKKPVLLGNWGENGALLSSLVTARNATGAAVRGLARRPRYDLAEFWDWGGKPPPTNPKRANQHGWFYPAHAHKRALFQVVIEGTKTARFAPREALAILARHGVPTRR